MDLPRFAALGSASSSLNDILLTPDGDERKPHFEMPFYMVVRRTRSIVALLFPFRVICLYLEVAMAQV